MESSLRQEQSERCGQKEPIYEDIALCTKENITAFEVEENMAYTIKA